MKDQIERWESGKMGRRKANQLWKHFSIKPDGWGLNGYHFFSIFQFFFVLIKTLAKKLDTE